MIYIIDTHSWIEYFNGSDQGKRLSYMLLNKGTKFITMECCLAEIRYWALRNNQNFYELLKVIRTNSVIFKVLEATWLEAAEVRYIIRKTVPHFGLIDAILIAKQRELGCKIISGDPHFKGLKDVVYIGK